MRAALLLLCVACTADVSPSSPVVGGACSSNSQCADECVTDGDFSAGLCTRRCDNDSGCPGGSVCVDSSNNTGICAPACSQASDCDPYGRGWTCHKDDRHGAPGEVNVCEEP